MNRETQTKDSTHTPGPWELHAEVEGHNSVRICKPDAAAFRGCWSIAEADILGADRKEVEANARLIAAAPELLEALEAFVETAGFEDDPVRVQARAAIKKARGHE